MTDRTVETSPQTYARIGGVLYLIIIVAGGFAELFVRDKLIVSRDATATANNIMASESLWRIAFVATLVMLACAVALTLIFYLLLRPVNRNIALLAAFFNLVSIAIEGMNDLYHFAAVLILVGVLVIISALSYVTNSFALFLSPAFARLISPGILVPAGVPELILCLWLIVKGVNVPKWEEKTSAGRVSGA